MRNNHKYIEKAFIIVVFLGIFFWRAENSLASNKLDQLGEGAYSLDYVILHAQTDSASIANDYFEKPAYLIVRDGEQYIRFVLNHSEWTKELQAPFGDSFIDVNVISEDKKKNTRVVQFNVDRDLQEPIEFKMHVLIKSMEPVYDHRYTVRFNFDLESLEELEGKEIEKLEIKETDFIDVEKNIKASQSNEKSEAKNNILIYLFTILFVLFALFILLIWRKYNKKK